MLEFESVDARGNIRFIKGEGVIVTFSEKDDTGAIVDPATHPRFFNIESIAYRVQVEVDLADPTAYRLVIPVEITDILFNIGGAEFSLTDEQTAVEGVVVPISLWSGTIKNRNPNE